MGDIRIGPSRIVTDQFYASNATDQVDFDGSLNSNPIEVGAHLAAIDYLEERSSQVRQQRKRPLRFEHVLACTVNWLTVGVGSLGQI